MALGDMDEANTVVLEKAVRNMLSNSRGKKPEEILNNPDALADYISDAYLVVRALAPNDNVSLQVIFSVLSIKNSKRDIATYIKTQIGPRMIEA